METGTQPLGQTSDRGINISVQVYNAPAQINVEPNCKAIMLTNVGDTIVHVNGMVLFPSSTPATDIGDSRTIGGDENEIFKGLVLRLAFNLPLGAAPALEVVQLFYVS